MTIKIEITDIGGKRTVDADERISWIAYRKCDLPHDVRRYGMPEVIHTNAVVADTAPSIVYAGEEWTIADETPCVQSGTWQALYAAQEERPDRDYYVLDEYRTVCAPNGTECSTWWATRTDAGWEG